MIEIQESSFIIVVVDQFVDHHPHHQPSSHQTDDLMTIMKLVPPFTSVSNRPIYTIQQRDMAKVHRQLNKENYILTSSYYQAPSNILYACPPTEINDKISHFMKETNAYEIIYELHEYNVRICLELVCQRVKQQLDILYDHQYINAMQYALLTINRSNVQLDQLCFLPDLRKYDIPFEPMMISFNAPTTTIDSYLYQILAPIYYEQVAKEITFFQGSDAVHAMEIYHQQGRLRSQTLFATIQLHHLSTLFSHSYAIQCLKYFLHQYLPNDGHLQGLSVVTILQLVHFLLSHQYFIYQNKFYRQTKGGPSNLPWMNLLANISMFYWQKQLVYLLHQQKEIFGRCFDQLFFTWNKSNIELVHCINQISHQQATPFQLITTIGTTVNYMDVVISHTKGLLQTKVFHSCPFEPYCLPYIIIDHPFDSYFTLIRAALLRAMRCCNHVHDFQIETNFIQLSLLLNHFSSTDIEQCFNLFFNQELKSAIHSFSYCQQDYDRLRQRRLEHSMDTPACVSSVGLTSSRKLKRQRRRWRNRWPYPASRIKSAIVVD